MHTLHVSRPANNQSRCTTLRDTCHVPYPWLTMVLPGAETPPCGPHARAIGSPADTVSHPGASAGATPPWHLHTNTLKHPPCLNFHNIIQFPARGTENFGGI